MIDEPFHAVSQSAARHRETAWDGQDAACDTGQRTLIGGGAPAERTGWAARLVAVRDDRRHGARLRTMAGAQLTQPEASLAAAEAEGAQARFGEHAG